MTIGVALLRRVQDLIALVCLIAALGAGVCTATAAQSGAQPAASATGAKPGAPTVVILTTKLGEIHIALDTKRAPVTSENFLRYVDSGRYDGITFYRAMNYRPDGSEGLVQGGLQGSRRKALPPIAHESTVDTGLSHVNAAVSMARGDEPGTATSEFFIVVGNMANFDGVPNGGDAGFAVFGRVVKGMPVVRRMMSLPRSKESRSLAMRGQMLAEPVTIVTARRAP